MLPLGLSCGKESYKVLGGALGCLVGVTSSLHSLTRRRAKRRCKLVLTPVFDSYRINRGMNQTKKTMIEIRSRLQIIERTENKPRRTCPLLKVRARTHIATICVIKIAARPKIANPSAADLLRG